MSQWPKMYKKMTDRLTLSWEQQVLGKMSGPSKLPKKMTLSLTLSWELLYRKVLRTKLYKKMTVRLKVSWELLSQMSGPSKRDRR